MFFYLRIIPCQMTLVNLVVHSLIIMFCDLLIMLYNLVIVLYNLVIIPYNLHIILSSLQNHAQAMAVYDIDMHLYTTKDGYVRQIRDHKISFMCTLYMTANKLRIWWLKLNKPLMSVVIVPWKWWRHLSSILMAKEYDLQDCIGMYHMIHEC